MILITSDDNDECYVCCKGYPWRVCPEIRVNDIMSESHGWAQLAHTWMPCRWWWLWWWRSGGSDPKGSLVALHIGNVGDEALADNVTGRWYDASQREHANGFKNCINRLIWRVKTKCNITIVVERGSNRKGGNCLEWGWSEAPDFILTAVINDQWYGVKLTLSTGSSIWITHKNCGNPRHRVRFPDLQYVLSYFQVSRET